MSSTRMALPSVLAVCWFTVTLQHVSIAVTTYWTRGWEVIRLDGERVEGKRKTTLGP